MKVPDKLLLAAMGVLLVAAVTLIVLAWEVPDANAREEAGAAHGTRLAHDHARFRANPDGPTE